MRFSSLRSRILVGMVAVAVVCSLAMILGVGAVIDAFAERSIVDRLQAARTSFQRYLDGRYRLLRSMVASVAESPRLKATLGIEDVDAETVKFYADENRAVLSIDLVTLTDARGAVLAVSSDSGLTHSSLAGLSAVREPLKGNRFSGILTDTSSVYLIASAPVTVGGQLLGVIVAGERVDSRMVTEFREAIATDVLVMLGAEPVAWSTTTAPPEGDSFDPTLVARQLVASPNSSGAVRRVQAGGMDCFATAVQLGRNTLLVLSRSAADLAVLEQYLWRWIVGFGVLAVCAAILFSRWIATRLSSPLRDLVQAADRVAGGDLDTVVGTSSMEETDRLGNAFNHMTEKVRALVEDVRAKAEILQHQRNELEWSNQAKSNFLITASHELRTPVTNIVSSSEILNQHGGDSDPATRQEFLDMIDAEASRISVLVDQLLDVAKMDTGSMQLNFEEFDLGAAVRGLVDAFRRGPGKNWRITFQSEEDLGTCVGDRRRLLVVLEQLLDNAVKFTPSGSPVVISLCESEGEFELRIADRGPGFGSAEARERAFERFVQGGNVLTEKPAGVGLGLSIARDIARAHAGELRCEEHAGGGAVFVLTIPTGKDLGSDLTESIAR